MVSITVPLLLVLICCRSPSKSELFTALVDLEKLLYTEGEVVRTLERYLDIEERRLEQLRWLKGKFTKLHQRASIDIQTFLSNPINAYLLVKQLTSDWRATQKLLMNIQSIELLKNITRNRQDLQFPDDEDLSGAAIALMRLQDTYKLDTSSLARGLIEGTKNSPELTANDCFELGRQSFKQADFHYTSLWMKEALNRVEVEENKTVKKVLILEYIAYAMFMDGNVKHALKLTQDILNIDPNHPQAAMNYKFYKNALNQSETGKRGDDGAVPLEPNTTVPEDESKVQDEIYKSLCRGEKIITEKSRGKVLNALFFKPSNDESKLDCQYFTNGDPNLLLQPVKVEIMYLDPRIVLYHNVLSDKEIATLKSLAQPKLQRATVQISSSGKMEHANYRISKSAWLTDNEHRIVERVSRRIGYVTGLSMETAEELQVVNYGIGGHYMPHYDYVREEDGGLAEHLITGNRIATWLSYMSDVDAGGATVFPLLGIGLKPKKGSAAFWYNLLKNGDGDLRTKHAACPVLAGSKWVSNKWLHEAKQEFRRRCSLNQYE